MYVCPSLVPAGTDCLAGRLTLQIAGTYSSSRFLPGQRGFSIALYSPCLLSASLLALLGLDNSNLGHILLFNQRLDAD